MPLVSGSSYIKWYLTHSMHAEHRGRTGKCAMDKPTHRVTYNYSKIVPIRISIDRNNHLTDCPIEFEVLQELPSAPGAKDERITLGRVQLNLSEYVEESENFPRRGAAAAAAAGAAAGASSRLGAGLDNAREKAQNIGQGLTHRRMSSKSSAGEAGGANISPTSTNLPTQQQQQQPHPEENDVVDEEAEEGIVRRYLMQDSKINSTLKVGILMVQVDGERNYVAPPLKTAPMFAGITGIMAGGDSASTAATEPTDAAATAAARSSGGAMSSLNKSRDVSEVQDMYRRALAASWSCQPGELPADECIEDIFSGGDGWRRSSTSSHGGSSSGSHRNGRGGSSTAAAAQTRSSSGAPAADEGRGAADDESVNSNSNNSNSNSNSASPDEAARGTSVGRSVLKRHARRQSGGSNHSDRSARSGITVMGGSDRDRDFRSRAPPLPEPSSLYTHSFSQHHQQQQQNFSSHFNLPVRSNSSSNNSYQHLRPPSSRGREDSTLLSSSSLLYSQRGGIPHDPHDDDGILHRSGSMASLAPTLGASSSTSTRSSSDRGRRFGGFRRQKEVDEHEIREDLIAWKLPGTSLAA